MKAIDTMRTHISNLCCKGLTQVAMVDVGCCLDAIEHELEKEYVPLPKDADGVPIHIGDEMYENENYHDRMSFMWLTEEGWVPCCFDCVCESLHHYKPPTVEDVLEKALNEAAMLDREEGYWPSAADITNIVNELAPKLQLREEGE